MNLSYFGSMPWTWQSHDENHMTWQWYDNNHMTVTQEESNYIYISLPGEICEIFDVMFWVVWFWDSLAVFEIQETKQKMEVWTRNYSVAALLRLHWPSATCKYGRLFDFVSPTQWNCSFPRNWKRRGRKEWQFGHGTSPPSPCTWGGSRWSHPYPLPPHPLTKASSRFGANHRSPALGPNKAIRRDRKWCKKICDIMPRKIIFSSPDPKLTALVQNPIGSSNGVEFTISFTDG